MQSVAVRSKHGRASDAPTVEMGLGGFAHMNAGLDVASELPASLTAMALSILKWALTMHYRAACTSGASFPPAGDAAKGDHFLPEEPQRRM
eukprot:8038406-Pyramimonas_sp.AAC.2